MNKGQMEDAKREGRMTSGGQGHDGPTVLHIVPDMNAMPRVAKYYTDEREAIAAAQGQPVYCYRAGTWAIYAVEVRE